MAMKELYFKVTIANKKNLPLSTKEIRDNPTFHMYMAEYDEKLINVMYTPAPGFDEFRFIRLMKAKLKNMYGTSIVEHLEQIKKLS